MRRSAWLVFLAGGFLGWSAALNAAGGARPKICQILAGTFGELRSPEGLVNFIEYMSSKHYDLDTAASEFPDTERGLPPRVLVEYAARQVRVSGMTNNLSDESLDYLEEFFEEYAEQMPEVIQRRVYAAIEVIRRAKLRRENDPRNFRK